MSSNLQQYSQILEAQSYFHILQLQHWYQFELFTRQWWYLLAVLIISWLIWWKLVDKKSVFNILCYGFVIMFIVIAMDAIGIVKQRWIYPIKLIPVAPHTEAIDWGLLPVVDMLIYQYFPKWKNFIIAEVFLGAALAFLGEPFAQWLGVYTIINWKHIWSFPIYILKSILAKFIIETIAHKSQTSS
ncbi:CBO0543 family protein [Dendrosporobacter sp. 1207_IL3150]|uniref:CBO0543 family protein n=1 Tax=Dendrosporobacter sp. 1207_IL3150 TaxID=3084054 RepID=UPI002FD8C075